MNKMLLLGGVAFVSFAAQAVVYRPGLYQARFSGSGLVPKSGNPTLIEDLRTQTTYNPVSVDYTYGTLMANKNGGNGEVSYANGWSGKSYTWSDYSLFAYEGEIFVKAGETLAIGGCFDDGSAAKVAGNMLFHQGSQSGYSVNCTFDATFAPDATGWYPINAWVYDWDGGKNIRSGYVSGIAYNLVGNTSQPTDDTIWSKLVDDGKMSLLRVKTDESFLEVGAAIGKTADGIIAPLRIKSFPSNCSSADIVVCWGASDGGTLVAGWDHSAVVKSITAADVGDSFVASIDSGAASAQVVRICLSHIDADASESSAVSSFEDWSEPFENLPLVEVESAIGQVEIAQLPDYVDNYPRGEVAFFGDGATSASASLQFSASDAFDGDIVESPSITLTESSKHAYFIYPGLNGKGAGFVRLKLVNDKNYTSYSATIPYAPPPAINIANYSRMVEYSVAYEGQSEAMTGFPVCVRLAEGSPTAFTYADCAADGGDLAFFDVSGSVRYSFDIDEWNTSGESVVWVRLPLATAGTKFVMCYGRAGQVSASNAVKVWSDYIGVWHMAESSGIATDSTGNELHGTPKAGASATASAEEVMVGTAGKVGTARVNSTTSGTALTYMSIPNYDSFALGGTFTISGWFKANAISGYPRLFSRKNSYDDDNGFEIEISDGSLTQATARGRKNSKTIKPTWQDLTADWRHLVFVYNDSTLTAFSDGQQTATGAIDAATDNRRPLSFGNNATGIEASFNGQYDEIRLSAGAKSAARVAAEYATMADAGFLSTEGAMSTDPSMPVFDSASVAWEDGSTKVTVALASGKGSISAVFTDVGTQTEYEVPLAEMLDATEGPVAATYTVPTSLLPAGRNYNWKVVATNNDLGFGMSFTGNKTYYAGEEDFSVRYVTPEGDDENTGLSLTKAKATIQSAVEALGAEGGTVNVAAGEYVFEPPAANQPLVTITAAVEVVGMTGNPADVVIRRTSTEAMGFKLQHTGAKLRYLTLDGMCIRSANQTNGGALYIVNGCVEDCVIKNTTGGWWASCGGGAYMENGRISRCVFKYNSMQRNDNFGVAIYAKGSSLIEDSLIVENTCEKAAAVVLEGSATMVNCTVANNAGSAGYTDGRSGVWARSSSSRVVNTAIFGNYGASDKLRVWDGTAANFTRCASDFEISGGVDCLVGNAGFPVGDPHDYHITAFSSSLDAGMDRSGTAATSLTDLEGNPRVAGPAIDIGCYEYPHDSFQVAFEFEQERDALPFTVTFRAGCTDPAGPVEYSWDCDGDGVIDATTTDPVYVWNCPAPGMKSITLIASDGVTTRTISLENAYYASPNVVYVAAAAQNPVYPYSTLETATADLQEALDITRSGAMVLVADGTYVRELGASKHNGFYLSNGVHVASISGDPATCIIKSTVRAGWDNFYHRCLSVNHPQAMVSGFTLADGSLEYYENGGCLYIGSAGGTVSNCVIRGGRTQNWGPSGAGAYVSAKGLLTHTVISNCYPVTDVRQTSHSALHVAGRVENCLVTHSGSSTSHNVVFVTSTGKLLNSTIVDSVCRTNYYYEGSWRANQVGVRADTGATIMNCAIYGITRGEEVEGEGRVVAPWTGSTDSFVNCATDGAAPVNETCVLIAKDAFVDYDGGDYTPVKYGALYNKGASVELSSSTDLAGNTRIFARKIDIGCYETIKSGFSLSLR